MNKHLVISALGKDRPGIVNEISKAILDGGGNVEDSRMAVLGGEFALILLVSGNDAAVAALTHQLPALERRLGLSLVVRPTEPRGVRPGMVPYRVSAVAMDHPGIVHDISAFFAKRQINIEELSTDTYPAPHTGTPMFSLAMTVSIPTASRIESLRQEFAAFCDSLNLDAALEPTRR